METLLQQANSLSNGQRFDVNFVGQNLTHKNKRTKCLFSQEIIHSSVIVLLKFYACESVLLAKQSGITW